MAKRTRIIEGTWNCTSCDRKDIPARSRSCPSCNNPREETGQESEFEFGGVDAASGRALREGTTDDKALSAAGAGEDWFCNFCGASNRGDAPQCHHCRAGREDSSRALQSEPDPSDAPPPPPPARKKSGVGRTLLYVSLGLVASCGALIFWGGRSHGVTGQVTGTEWTRTVHQERFQRVQREGWRDQLRLASPRMPVNGQGEVAGVENIRACGLRQRGTRQVADGTERVCSTKQRRVQCGTEEKCTRQKMGNGFMKETCDDVPKYCGESYQDCEERTRYRSEPVLDTSCTYDTYAWTPVTQRTESGHDSAPRWPALSPGALDRLRREEKYTVRIGYEQGGAKQHELTPPDESGFLAWKKGQAVPLKVNNFGSVELAADAARR